MNEFAQDLEFGCRTLLKSRGFTAVSLAVCHPPARRATRVNPIIALRSE